MSPFREGASHHERHFALREGTTFSRAANQHTKNWAPAPEVLPPPSTSYRGRISQTPFEWRGRLNYWVRAESTFSFEALRDLQ